MAGFSGGFISFAMRGARFAAIAAVAGMFCLPLAAKPATHKKAPPTDFVQPRADPDHPHTIDRPLGSESEAGAVILKFRVRKDGSVADIAVMESSSFKDLDDAAVYNVSRWRYLPATRDGQPVDAPYEAKVDFKAAEAPADSQAPTTPSLNEEILDLTPEQFVARCAKDRAWCEAHIAYAVQADGADSGSCPPKGMDKNAMTTAILRYMSGRQGDWDKIPALTMIGQADGNLWPCH